ncbi:MAG: hypothetical protein QNK11_00735 [Legionella sp.]|nr:hypothetical protein [Legionella sp.]
MSASSKNFWFPPVLSETFFLLKERKGMAPNLLADYMGSWLMFLATKARQGARPEAYSPDDFKNINLDGYNSLRFEKNKYGVQTVEAIRENATAYQIYFAGNLQDALNPESIKQTLHDDPTKNYIFSDYPGNNAYINVKRFDLFFKVGYKKVKDLITKKRINPEDITLHGYSMGGGVVAHIARRLHDEGHEVNLTIERSFADLSGVVSPLLYHKVDPYKQYLPFGTSLLAFSIIGISMGTILAGVIATIGLFIASLIAGIGYCLNLLLSKIPGSSLLVSAINLFFNAHAEYINACFNLFATIAGTVVSTVGFGVGLLLGTAVGLILSIQLLFTKNPYDIPIEKPAQILINTTTGEMNSFKNILYILKLKSHGKIKIINSKKDDVVHNEAALSTAFIKCDLSKYTDFSIFLHKTVTHSDHLNLHDPELQQIHAA